MGTAPNVLIVMTDQQRADFRKQQGFPLDTMPFLDSLVARGVQFDAAYTPMPICSPARNSMLTGRFPSAHGLIANWSPLDARYIQDLAGVMGEQGYERALFGKNHSYLAPAAFDTFIE
jgi:arylsulfatase A-like enzyme